MESPIKGEMYTGLRLSMWVVNARGHWNTVSEFWGSSRRYLNTLLFNKISKRKMFLNIKEFSPSRHFWKNYSTKNFRKPIDRKDWYGTLELNTEPSLNNQDSYNTHAHTLSQSCSFSLSRIYTHTYTNTYKYIYTDRYKCTHMCTYLYVYIHLCIYIFNAI